MTEKPPRADGQEKTTLSRELSEFLIELSIAVHRYAMYPSGHPSLEPAAGKVLTQLGKLLKERRSLTIGVARRQLVIEGVATDQSHPVLSDLARRLHSHQLGAVSFRREAGIEELGGLLETLAQESERTGEPVGLLPRDEIPRWENIRIYPVGYDHLELSGEERSDAEADQARRLWLGLAQAAMGTDDPADVTTDESVLAREIAGHGREAAYDQVIVGYLLQLAEQLKSGTSKEDREVREKVSGVIEALDQDTLERLLVMGGSPEQREQLVLDANESLTVDAVLKILQAAAESEEQTISHSLTRLLSKLAVHAEKGPGRVRGQADSALRENVEELVSGWQLQDPNPASYTMVLDQMAHASPIFEFSEGDPGADPDDDGDLTGAQRLLQMSLEVGAWGTTVQTAVRQMIEEGRTQELLALVDDAEDENEAVVRIREDVADPSQIKRMLRGVDVDRDSLRAVVERVGELAVDPLLDALIESESRAVRRKVFDLLTEMGGEIGDAVVRRLDDSRWFVLRNMLALVKHLDPRPEGIEYGRFLDHPDARVRREALPLILADGRGRIRALARGLSDSDERIVRMALLELQEGTPEMLVPTVVNRVIQAGRPQELRTLAVKALRGTRASLALDALVKVTTGGRSLLGRQKLADPTPEVLAALRILAHTWSDEPRADEILRRARASRDPEIRGAARGAGEVGS